MLLWASRSLMLDFGCFLPHWLWFVDFVVFFYLFRKVSCQLQVIPLGWIMCEFESEVGCATDAGSGLRHLSF